MSDKKSFFEYLGIADIERIHSQVFAWLFSNDCTALNSRQRNQLIKEIFKLENIGNILNTQTERGKIDILIQTDKEIIVIENKIKSSQHSDQLHTYKNYCEEEFRGYTKHFYFLTLIGEKTNHNDNYWNRITYTDVYKALKLVELNNNDTHSVIITEYVNLLERLTSVLEDFTKNVKDYDMVFQDGGKTKGEKINVSYENPNKQFIADNQLETILQKTYLASIVEKIGTGRITETRGDALIDFPLTEHIEYQGNKYSTMLEIQGDNLKFAFMIMDNYPQSDKKWIADIIPMMEKLLEIENKAGFVKLNKPKSKAYVSISKKLKTPYWRMEMDKLIEFIKTEIANGQNLTDKLLELIALEQ